LCVYRSDVEIFLSQLLAGPIEARKHRPGANELLTADAYRRADTTMAYESG